jgi:hypothetical protein
MGRKVTIRGKDELPFSIYSPSRVAAETKLITEAWDISDAPHVENLADLQNLQRNGEKRAPLNPPSLQLSRQAGD